MHNEKFIYNQLHTLDCSDTDYMCFQASVKEELFEILQSILIPYYKSLYNELFLNLFKNTEFARCLRDNNQRATYKVALSLVTPRLRINDRVHVRDFVETFIHKLWYNAARGIVGEDHVLFKTQIPAMLEAYYKGYFIRKVVNDLSIEWQWKSTRGTFIKRISSLLYNNFDKLTLSEENIAMMNKTIKKVKLNARQYHFDFDRTYTWNAGDFNDNHSCFWEGRENARVIMRDDRRFQALRTFEMVEKTKESKVGKIITRDGFSYDKLYYEDDSKAFMGESRCWLVHERVTVDSSLPKLQGEHNIYILFNAYGRSIEELAYLFRSYLALPNIITKDIHAGNGGTSGGTLFVNGSRAIVIGREDLVSHITYYDFSALERDYVNPATYKPASFIVFDTDNISHEGYSKIYSKAQTALRMKKIKEVPVPVPQINNALAELIELIN